MTSLRGKPECAVHCRPAGVGCEPSRRNARKANSEKEGRFPRYRGGHRRAAGQSVKAGKGWKAGAVHRDLLPAGKVDRVGGLSPNGIYWGLLSWTKAGRLSWDGELVQECCRCSRAVAEKGCGSSRVLPELCPRRSAQAPVPAHPAASLLPLQLARGFWQCRHVTLSPAAAILDLALDKAK